MATPDPLIGKQFGSYELASLLGRGGMAAVYRGYQASIDRSVAVKVLPGDLLHDPSFLTRFLNEARTLAKLNHPNILPLYDFGEANGMPYIVMPLMASGSLIDRLREGPLPLADAVRVIVAVAQALDFAHQQGVLHRDVKPNNILFDQHGNPFLADFGIAKAMEAQTSLTGTGLIGTPDYMSPEQASGDTLDGRSDIYSLAVVAYQALTGQLLFKATTPMAVIFKHVSEPPRPLREVVPGMPEAVEKVILKALAKKPSDRYQSALDFGRAMASAAATAEPPIFTPVTQRAESPPTSVNGPQTAAPPAPRTAGTAGPRPAVPAPAKSGGGMGLGMILGIGGGVVLCLALVCGGLFMAGVFLPDPTATPHLAATAAAQTEVALAQATPTPRPSSTPRPTATLRPSNTPGKVAVTPGGSTTALGDSLFEPFDDNDLNWTEGRDSDELADNNQAVVDGKYRWEITAKRGVVSWSWPDGAENAPADVVVAVEVERLSGVPDATAGLIVRRTDSDNYYYFSIDWEGDYAFFLHSDGEWRTLIDYTGSDLIRTNGVNRIAVQAIGADFAFFINGELVDSITDSTLLSAGVAALAVELHAAGDQALFEFDNFEVRPAWPLVLLDSFEDSSNRYDWPVETFSGDRVIASPSIRDGRYLIEAEALQDFRYRSTADIDSVVDFIAVVTGQRLEGTETSDYGLIFRQDEDEYYYFGVSDVGQYTFLRRDGGEWTTLIDWTESAFIRRGQPNRLEVRGQGLSFTLLINGQVVSQMDDPGSPLTSGQVGVAIAMYDPGQSGVFAFDDFEVRAP